MPHVLVAGKWHPSGLAMLEAEPHAPDHPLRAPSNVILTPHGAGLSRQSADQIAVSLAQNVLGFFAGSLDPSVIVNKDALS